MGKISEIRKKFVERTRKKRPTGLSLTTFGKVFKVKKHKL